MFLQQTIEVGHIPYCLRTTFLGLGKSLVLENNPWNQEIILVQTATGLFLNKSFSYLELVSLLGIS